MWEASAPSNIALIKYMGKKADGNIPSNSSISWTLDYLRSFVQLEENPGATEDRWEPHDQLPPMHLTDKGRAKFLKHFENIKKQYGQENRHFILRSGNNFPSDCGIASSASSFAALTLCAVRAMESYNKSAKALTTLEIAQLSRRGSGSSCRSLFPGWVSWVGDQVTALEAHLKSLVHMVVVVSDGVKSVSSSEAHQRINSSSLVRGRTERAEERFRRLEQEIAAVPCDWKTMYELAWADFWDMHALFETSQPPFGYMTAGSLEILQKARGLWEAKGDGPIVTMDAGPNVHLLWRPDQKAQAIEFKQQIVEFKVLSSWGEA